MSNELSTPKVLVCPQETDASRTCATTFSNLRQTAPPGVVSFTNDFNLSYFVGVDADQTYPTMPLSGDRNLAANGVPLRHGLHALSASDLLNWVKPRHNGGGNICFADGSVQGLGASAVKNLLAGSGAATNRLAVP